MMIITRYLLIHIKYIYKVFFFFFLHRRVLYTLVFSPLTVLVTVHWPWDESIRTHVKDFRARRGLLENPLIQHNFEENIDIGIPCLLSVFLMYSPRNVDYDISSVFLCLLTCCEIKSLHFFCRCPCYNCIQTRTE